MNFHENTSSGSRVVPCAQTERQDEAINRHSAYESAQKNTYPKCAECAETVTAAGLELQSNCCGWQVLVTAAYESVSSIHTQSIREEESYVLCKAISLLPVCLL